MKRRIASLAVGMTDALLLPLTVVGSVVLRYVRTRGVERMPLSRAVFDRVGVFPIRRHYYEPLFDASALATSLRADRHLPAVDLNEEEQLRLLERFAYAEELRRIPLEPGAGAERRFYYNNDMFASGDAEYLYSMIRLHKPRRIVEIGSGFSTLMAREAIAANAAEDPTYECRHTCVEPYENAWLGALQVDLVREPVERVDRNLFTRLERNDILFIDSSHVIRPQGDVVCEYLEILPLLRPGVLVHVHDIFTPKDYLDAWVRDRVLLWNEQYLLEAFLSYNSRFEVVGAVNFLSHHHRAALAAKFPVYAAQAAAREPGSFWLRVRDGGPAAAPRSGGAAR